MSLHESAWGGVYLSPLFVYACWRWRPPPRCGC